MTFDSRGDSDQFIVHSEYSKVYDAEIDGDTGINYLWLIRFKDMNNVTIQIHTSQGKKPNFLISAPDLLWRKMQAYNNQCRIRYEL